MVVTLLQLNSCLTIEPKARTVVMLSHHHACDDLFTFFSYGISTSEYKDVVRSGPEQAAMHYYGCKFARELVNVASDDISSWSVK